MRAIVKIDAVKLATGIQAILLDMCKDGRDADKVAFPIYRFEQMIQEQHGVSREQAEKVTEKVINTGIIRWSLSDNCFVL